MIDARYIGANASNGADAGGGTVTVSSTITGSSGVLVVCVGLLQNVAGTGTVSTITANGRSLTSGRVQTQVTMRSEIWYLVSPDVGTYNVVMTTTGATDDRKISVIHLTGVNPINPTDAVNSAGGTASPATVANTTTKSKSVIVASVANATNAASLTPSTGVLLQTNSDTSGTTSFVAGVSGVITTPAATTMAWTKTGTDNWAITSVSFRAMLPNMVNTKTRPYPFSPGMAR
jgi:hypothetical protein